MNDDWHSPIQFGLNEIFALTAFIAVLLGLLPIAYASATAAVGVYHACGVLQLICAWVVYRRFRTARIGDRPAQPPPYRRALLAACFSLGMWLLLVAQWLEERYHVRLIWSFDALMWLILYCLLAQIPAFLLSVIGLIQIRDRAAHWPLATLFLLNLTNSALVFAVIPEIIGPGP